ncbi:hypothetical protein [Mucilaginibacter sp. L3T2-6]|uniref:hypothetical protein n=1 Tax=Mucilaginibacter sp. L3T2-6 TaxID=3062491 RepID=UPI002674C62A|nr:hypothetical protein [Mucilaginibacter sp. L3T2-6]MDO3643836.1 hypothetical protein [Mucilaginibacter sp. L3T2-6]MDV6216287.1 hypothetical protein [Mucilaginibacter sp. L3T2-6]
MKTVTPLTGKSLLSQLINADRPVLTAKKFLGKEQEPGYFKSEELITFLQSYRKREIGGLKTVVLGMKEGLRVGGTIEVREDKGGREYVYVTMLRVNSSTGGKFIYEAGMIKFLHDYLDGKFIAGFTLEELVEEAKQV